jgi:peptide/nickel transport system substrate-binding protein
VRVHRGKALVAGIAALALALTACGSGKGSGGGSNNNGGSANTAGTKGTGNLATCGSSPNDCNTASVKKGGSFIYTLEKTILGWNTNSSNSSTFENVEVLDGLLPSVFIPNPDLKPALNTDLMISAEQTSASPQTLVYKIKPEAVWDDGTPIDSKDFEYQLKTQDGISCPACGPATTSSYDQVQSLTASDSGKTVTVVMKKPYADWQSMFGPMYPAHVAAKHGDVSTAKGLASSFVWLDKNVPTYSGGPYKITAADKETSVTEVPNPTWFGQVKPSLDKLIFRVITDQTQEVPALTNNEVQGIYPQPNADMVTSASAVQGVSTYIGKGLNWEHLDFNTTGSILKDKTLRTAIFTAISRKQIIDKTIGQFVPNAVPLNNHMYVPGQPGYKDNITATGQGSGDVAKAKQMLTDAGYTGVGSSLKNKDGRAVSIRCSYTAGNQLRQQTCQLIQSQLGALGIKVKPTTLADLGGTLDSGDFDLIIFAWTGAPFVVAGAQQIFKLKGGGDYGKNNDPAMEKLLDAASTETDPAKVQDDLNQADAMLTADAYNLAIFQKPTFIATYSNMANVRDNATSTGPPYNVQSWGVRAA